MERQSRSTSPIKDNKGVEYELDQAERLNVFWFLINFKIGLAMQDFKVVL